MATFQVTIRGLNLNVTGRYTKAEPEVGLKESFEIHSVTTQDDISDLLAWANTKEILSEVEEACIKQIN